jgi:alditol oxidase
VETNWAGNVVYGATRILRPASVEEAQELVAAEPRIRALGTRHSFSSVADTTAVLLSTESLSRVVDVDERGVTVEAGITYAELSRVLLGHGLAVANMASLPHISVGGAIATATHGSGASNQSLAATVSALELVGADGEITLLRRGDEDFDGAVVSLGALGVVARVTLDVVPAFELRQVVFEGLQWAVVEEHLAEILDAAYSVSLFTTWAMDTAGRAWVKSLSNLGAEFFGGRAATLTLHPVPGADTRHATEQLGIPGPSGERLPHFRPGFVPSAGDELQSEYVVAREHGVAALHAVRALAPEFAPLLLVSEVRAIASDSLWLSPFVGRDSIAFHFTWKPLGEDVLRVLPRIEAALAPFAARPHWGKVFVGSPELLESLYPQLPAFRALRARLDPDGSFDNAFVDGYLGT